LRGVKAVSPCVLVAEDEALIALTLKDMLDDDGHEVHLAFDGSAALEAAQRLGQALDVLVTDLNMPGLTGEDLIRALTINRPLLPIVVLTGSPPRGGLEQLRRDCGGHGPLTLLHKPTSSSDVLAAVRCASVLAERVRPIQPGGSEAEREQSNEHWH
ncbi:response regulator, partial [Falsiroseomonas sp. HC035]|uniref:response regulator n=1 Tax=Falsiroseomonas sp. HC035 TaxID=3390999 RepID=UPI003D31E9BF